MKAIALYSGGLDSTLAVLVMRRLGAEVLAINFTTPFGCAPEDKSSCSHASDSLAQQYGFTLKYSPLGDIFIDLVKKPAHGYGKNMNPCIDCRILMLREAKKIMEKTGADFIITGEVLGQRPMSQHRSVLDLIEAETGLKGYLLRPLSAKLLSPTTAEEKGLIKRCDLYGFSGRGRKNQLALAGEFKLKVIPQPASGCLLTDPIYSRKFRGLLEHDKDCDNTDIMFLRLGRHFRLSDTVKLIIGRDEQENLKIEKLAGKDILFFPQDDIPGPTAIITGENIREQHLELSARICAKYCDRRDMNTISIHIKDAGGGNSKEYRVKPAEQELLNKYSI